MERRMGRSDWAFLGGMLHDVGKSLALGALARSIGGGRAPADVPEPVLEALLEHVHVELGREAHARWQLPDYLRELCAEHHAQTCPLTDDTRELHLVRVVSGLYALRARTQPIERVGELANSLVTLAFTPAQVRAIDTGLRSRATQARQILER
jgi:HD-like signal output (HDOD) protein